LITVLALLRDRWHRLRARARALAAARLRFGSSAYRRRLDEEIEHYAQLYSSGETCRLTEPAPPAWIELQERAAHLIRQHTGADLAGHVTRLLKARPHARMLSLGSGAGGVELALAREAPAAEILCLDINPAALELGRAAAAAERLHVRFAQADLNRVELEAASFDVVFCHASLHHVLELERLLAQVERALRPGGALVVVDIITRNGYRMWPETRRLAGAIFRTLPARYRLNHTAYLPHKRVDRRIWNGDTRGAGMECLRSEELLPLIRSRFDVECLVAYFALCRRFFDTMYGPNYDLARPLDRAILDWIWELDRHLLETGRLRPETFFGIFRRRAG
jgi:SAM-dependent methyltransferase